MLQRSGEIISDIIGNDFETSGTETTIEINLAVLSVKHVIKRDLHYLYTIFTTKKLQTYEIGLWRVHTCC